MAVGPLQAPHPACDALCRTLVEVLMRGLVVLSARTCPRAVHGLVVEHGVELHRAFCRGAALVDVCE